MKMRVLVATPTAFLREAWAFAVANTLTVATRPIFIDRSDLKKVMGHFHENAVLGGGSRSVATLMDNPR